MKIVSFASQTATPMNLKKSILIFWLIFSFSNINGQTIDEKVDSVLNLMTLDEKIGQMTQVERNSLESLNDLSTFSIGSLLSGGGSSPSPNNMNAWRNMYDNFQDKALESRLGIPLIYGVDAVHGHNNVIGAVIFPHNIGLGCTWNPDLVEELNRITALEVAATGIDWTFAPCIAVARDERWGRTYEGFGETAEIQEIMSEASVRGLQGSDLSKPETIVACAKHYVGDGGTNGGIDQGNTVISEDELRAIHLPGYIDAIEAGVGTIMASFNSWNGTKLHGHDYLLTDVLKNELGFEGFVISDWAGVDQITGNYREAIKRAINAGIDMVMVPDRYEVFIGHLKSLVDNNEVSEARIDDAVRRILKQKFLMDLFEKPYTDQSLGGAFGSEEHRQVGRQAVRESLVLLDAKNDVLPLMKNDQTILVAGTLAKDIGAQCGGWSISWQGGNGNITPGTDIFTGIQNASGTSQVIYSANGNYSGDADVAVVVIGEKKPYAEGAGDRVDLSLSEDDVDLLKRVKEKGIPTVAVLISGRPMIIGDLLAFSDAFLAAWYPGTEAQGIADVLFGDYKPVGKLTHSWPRNMRQVPVNWGDQDYDPLYPYKHGLQDFPVISNAADLEPYTASTTEDGANIMLLLKDEITTLNATAADFEIAINDEIRNGLIENVELSGIDESIILLLLNEPLEVDDKISLTYSGNGIASGGLILKPFQDLYVHNAMNPSNSYHSIPGRLEAEHFFEMSGIQTENCSDTGGGLNVGYIDGGDWLKYYISVGQSGKYKITGRISGFNAGSLLMIFDGSTEARINYNSTNSWQNWKDFSTEVVLEKGSYVLEVRAQSEGFNINYFDFDFISSTVDQPYPDKIDILQVFPNPIDDQFYLEFYNPRDQNITIKLFDYGGKELRVMYQGHVQYGLNKFEFDLNKGLPAGIYFVEVRDATKRYFTRLIKQG